PLRVRRTAPDAGQSCTCSAAPDRAGPRYRAHRAAADRRGAGCACDARRRIAGTRGMGRGAEPTGSRARRTHRGEPLACAWRCSRRRVTRSRAADRALERRAQSPAHEGNGSVRTDRVPARVAAAAALLLAACAPATNGGAEQNTSTVDDAAYVVMERGPCFGTCPVYEVRVDAKGLVTFEGRRFVDATGTATAEITGDSAAALMRSIEADGFFDLDPRYIYGERGCGAYHTDAPHVTLTLSLGGRTHTVQHDYGCTGAPDVLRRMHDRVDAVAGVGRWISR